MTCVFGKENIQSKLEEKIVKDTLFSKNLFQKDQSITMVRFILG